MAAVVERPSYPLIESQPLSQGQLRTPVEIIDVDLLDDNGAEQLRPAPRPRPVLFARASQPIRRPRVAVETISLLDDSDDEHQIAGPSGSMERRRLFSPPPPRHSGPTLLPPPVPNVPHRFSWHTSFPMRARAPAHPPPPIVRPVDRGFSFEWTVSRSQSPAAGPSNHNQGVSNGGNNDVPRAAPASHHVPTMGLGGALLTNNRARAVQDQRNFAHESSRGMLARIERAITGTSLRRIYPGIRQPPNGIEDDLLVANDFADGIFPPDILYNIRGLEDETFLRFHNQFHQPLQKEHYKISYTHPPTSEAGFTFDFAPPSSPTAATSSFPPSSISDPIVVDDDESDTKPSGKETGRLNSLLVCARCLDPLVLNSGLTQPETTLRRVWALRCGHIIDGKCLAEIGQPAAVLDPKGKGKAKEDDEDYIPYGDQPRVHQSISDVSDASLLSPESNNIRSRLRSQHSGSSSTPSAASQSAAASRRPPSATTVKKRKRTSNKLPPNKKLKVEEEYEWKCPVAACEKMHVSVKIGGVWGPEKERQLRGYAGLVDADKGLRGAIAIFA